MKNKILKIIIISALIIMSIAVLSACKDKTLTEDVKPTPTATPTAAVTDIPTDAPTTTATEAPTEIITEIATEEPIEEPISADDEKTLKDEAIKTLKSMFEKIDAFKTAFVWPSLKLDKEYKFASGENYIELDGIKFYKATDIQFTGTSISSYADAIEYGKTVFTEEMVKEYEKHNKFFEAEGVMIALPEEGGLPIDRDLRNIKIKTIDSTAVTLIVPVYGDNPPMPYLPIDLTVDMVMTADGWRISRYSIIKY